MPEQTRLVLCVEVSDDSLEIFLRHCAGLQRIGNDPLKWVRRGAEELADLRDALERQFACPRGSYGWLSAQTCHASSNAVLIPSSKRYASVALS